MYVFIMYTQHFTIFIHVPGNTAFVLCILSLRDMKARLMMYLTLIQLFQHIQCFNYQFILRIVHYIFFVIWHYFWPPEEEKQIIGRQPKKQKIL